MFILDTEKLILKLKEEGGSASLGIRLKPGDGKKRQEQGGTQGADGSVSGGDGALCLYGEKRAGTICQRPHRRKCLQI